MQANLFGQFLIANGVASEAQFFSALAQQRSTNVLLGQLAIEQGMLNVSQADGINNRQAKQNKCFGDIAIEQGLLTEQQIEQLLNIQKTRNKRIGEILVEKGVLSKEALTLQLRQHQADCDSAIKYLEMNVAHHPLRATLNTSIDICNSLFLRVLHSRCHVKNLIDDYAKETSFTNTSHMVISGDESFKIALACGDETLINIASIFVGIDKQDVGIELAQDVLGEYLNVLVGQLLEELRVGDGESERSVQSMSISAATLLDDCDHFLVVEMISQLGGFVLLVTD